MVFGHIFWAPCFRLKKGVQGGAPPFFFGGGLWGTHFLTILCLWVVSNTVVSTKGQEQHLPIIKVLVTEVVE